VLFTLIITLGLNSASYAEESLTNTQIAPQHINLINQRVLKKVKKWLDKELKFLSLTNNNPSTNIQTTDTASKYTLTSIFIKHNQWENTHQFPLIEETTTPPAAAPWYQKILDYFDTFEEKKPVVITAKEKIIDQIKVIISFNSEKDKQSFSTELQFKLRKQIYLELTKISYTPLFISVIAQTDIPKINNNLPPLSPESTFSSDKKRLLLEIILLLISLVLIILFIKRLIKKKSVKEKKSISNKTKTSSLSGSLKLKNEHPPTEKPLSANDSNKSSSVKDPTLTLSKQQKTIQNLKNDLFNQLIGTVTKHPYFLRKIYEIWQQRYNKSTGKNQTPYVGEKIVILYDILEKKVIEQAIPTLSQNELLIIENQLNDLQDNTEKWQTLYQEVKQDIQYLEQHLDNPDPYQTPFGFIKAMPDQAIILLLNNKAQHIQSITLAQFDAARCQSLVLHLSEPKKHKSIMREIEHYRKYDGYFFQDVASYLCYSLTQTVFQDNTVPIDEVSATYAEQSPAETQRALGDFKRQQNLGLVTPKNTTNEQQDVEDSQPRLTAIDEPYITNTSDNTFVLTNDSQPLSADNFINTPNKLTPQPEPTPTDNTAPSTSNLQDESNSNEPLSKKTEDSQPKIPSTKSSSTKLQEPEDYKPSIINKNSLANEWFDFGNKK
jgi:hypothetical protein